MNTARGVCVAALLACIAHAQDPSVEALAQRGKSAVTIAIDVGRERRFVGEAAVVQVVVRFDRAFFAEHGAPMFARQLDVPLQVVAPWLDGGEVVALLPDARDEAVQRLRIVCNERVIEARALGDVTEDGRAWGELTFVRRLAPRSVGRLELSAPIVRFVAATQFRDDFINGRMPMDRVPCEVTGQANAWSVEELPAAGKPASFCGAVGAIELSARASSTSVGADGRIDVEVVVRGDGDLWSWPPPQLRMAGAHVLGVLDRGGKGERVFALELEIDDPKLSALPPIELGYFDAAAGSYAVAKSNRVELQWTEPLRVRPSRRDLPDVAPSAAAGASRIDVLPSRALPKDATRSSGAAVTLALAMPWVVFCAVAIGRRMRSRSEGAPRDARARAARLLAAIESADADLLHPFEQWACARLRCAELPQADDALARELERFLPSSDLALRLASLRRTLVAGRYAGMSAAARVAAHRVVEEAERAFVDAEALR